MRQVIKVGVLIERWYPHECPLAHLGPEKPISIAWQAMPLADVNFTCILHLRFNLCCLRGACSSGDSTHQDHSLYLDGLEPGNLGDLLLNGSLPGDGLDFMSFPDPTATSSIQEDAGTCLPNSAPLQMSFQEQLRHHSDDESAGGSGTKGVSSSGRGFPTSPQHDTFTSGCNGVLPGGPAVGPSGCSPGPGTSSCSQQSHAEAKSDSEKGPSGAAKAGDSADEEKKREVNPRLTSGGIENIWRKTCDFFWLGASFLGTDIWPFWGSRIVVSQDLSFDRPTALDSPLVC